MNPFDLAGPEFLLFYAALTAVVLTLAYAAIRVGENGPAPRIDFGDPYLIAYLRGGTNEVLRVAAVGLIDRGLLQVTNDDSLELTDSMTSDRIRHPVEAAILKQFKRRASTDELFRSSEPPGACAAYDAQLRQLQLLPDAAQQGQRRRCLLMAGAVLFGVSVVKLWLAYQRGRSNVLFLILGTVAAIVAAGVITHPRLTSRGAAALADLRHLFADLRDRSGALTRGGTTNEALLVASVFGISVLPEASFPYVSKLFHKTTTSSGTSTCGGGCGSSCGGCGGGCGGCGG